MAVDDLTGPTGSPVDELRTKRLVVIDDAGEDRAVIEVVLGHIQLRLLSGVSDGLSLILHSGYDEARSGSAGVEWWHQGNAIGASVLVDEGGEVWLHHRNSDGEDGHDSDGH